MAMEVSGSYGGYSNSYAAISNKRKTETGKEDVKGKNEVSSGLGEVRKTANDELSYLTSKYKDYTFVSANYTQGMRYGSNTTSNIAISPAFLKQMANDSKLEAEYEEKFSQLKKLDEQFVDEQNAMGRKVVAQGWAIDKNGGISGWCILENNDKRSGYGQKMTDYSNKLRKERLEHKKEKEKADDKKIKEKRKLELEKAKLEKSNMDEKLYISNRVSIDTRL